MLEHLFKRDKRSKIEKEIDAVLEIMKTYKPYSTEYEAMAENVTRLCKANNEHTLKARITPDGALQATVYIAGLWMVLNFEKAEIIRTKAFNQLLRVRL